MEYTEEQKSRFIEEFAIIRQRQVIAIGICLPLVTLFAYFGMKAYPDSGEAFGLIPVAALVAFSLKSWRCPACSRYFGKEFNPSCCPKCGVQLK
jgi:hypothetical protein